MESLHMTQQVFADFIGVNAATLSGIYNDRTRPTLNIVEAIKSKIPDISTDWLMFGSGTMYIPTAVVTDGDESGVKAGGNSRDMGHEGRLDFGDIPSTPLPKVPSTAVTYNGVRSTRLDIRHEEVKVVDKQPRRVTEIRVYYDDQTWESFVPSKK